MLTLLGRCDPTTLPRSGGFFWQRQAKLSASQLGVQTQRQITSGRGAAFFEPGLDKYAASLHPAPDCRHCTGKTRPSALCDGDSHHSQCARYESSAKRRLADSDGPIENQDGNAVEHRYPFVGAIHQTFTTFGIEGGHVGSPHRGHS